MTSRSQRHFALLVAPLVLLVLGGCFPDAAPLTTATPSPTRATPTPGSDAQPEPATSLFDSRLPIGCAELLSESVLSSALGVPADDIGIVPAEAPREIESAAAVQGGLVECEWRSPPEVDSVGVAWMRVQVLPDAGPAFHQHSRILRTYSGRTGLVVGTTGADSLLSCDFYEITRYCDGAFESHGYWVEYYFSGPMSGGVGVDQSDELADAVADALALALASAGSPAALAPVPAGTVSAWKSCSAIEAGGGFHRVTGSPTLTLRHPFDQPPLDIRYAAMPQSPYQDCYWEQSAYPAFELDDDADYYRYYQCDECLPYDYEEVASKVIRDEMEGIDVSVLPGGEWAWPSLKQGSTPMDARSVARLGVADGTLGCSSQWCHAQVLVDHTVVDVQFYYFEAGTATFDSAERALAIMHLLLLRLGA